MLPVFATKEGETTQNIVELYHIWQAEDHYYFTSANLDVTWATHSWKHLPIQRTDIQRSAEHSTPQLTITLYTLTDGIRKYITGNPAQRAYITIHRLHTDDLSAGAHEMFSGYISGVSFAGDAASITCNSLMGVLKFPVPRRAYQRVCTWNLYSIHCTIDVNSPTHTISTLIAGITNSTTLTVDSIGAFTSEYFKDGFCELIPRGQSESVLTGELRMITAHSGLTLSVQYPFSTDEDLTGRSIILRTGCDKSYTTCKDKFSNGTHFGGVPFVPTNNPSSIRPEDTDSDEA